MAKRTIDTRGRSCPEPVLMTQNALKTDAELEVLIDNPTALGNVSRLLNHQKKTFRVETRGEEWAILVEA